MNSFIDLKQWQSVYIIAFTFAVCMFVNGLLNGYFDNERLQRIDINFRYHLITYLVVNGMHFIFLLLPNTHYNLLNAFLSALFWGIGLFAHHSYSKKSIKGYAIEELFE
jgi:hypothetical protein